MYDELAKFGQHFLGKVPVFGNYLVSETYQKGVPRRNKFRRGSTEVGFRCCRSAARNRRLPQTLQPLAG